MSLRWHSSFLGDEILSGDREVLTVVNRGVCELRTTAGYAYNRRAIRAELPSKRSSAVLFFTYRSRYLPCGEDQGAGRSIVDLPALSPRISLHRLVSGRWRSIDGSGTPASESFPR
jgi:hypothetical protein